MALIHTPGAIDANTYATLEEFNAYLSTHPYGATALAKSGPEKEAALIHAARSLSSLCYNGIAAAANQALPFPRLDLTNRNGWPLDTTVIPAELKAAQSELARIILTTTSDPTAESDASAQGISRLKAGPVDITFAADAQYRPVPNAVLSMLVPSWLCDTVQRPKLVFRAI